MSQSEETHVSCNSGPQVRFTDIPLGEQVVTTIAHDKIPPKPPKPKPYEAVFWAIVWTFLTTVAFNSIFEVKIITYPSFHIKIVPRIDDTTPPYRPDPYHPPEKVPTPDIPDYYPDPQRPQRPPQQIPPQTVPPNYSDPYCPYPQLPQCGWQ